MDGVVLEYKFKDFDIAKNTLENLGLSLKRSDISDSYHIIPTKMDAGYPMMKNGEMPRFIALLDSCGRLAIVRPYDDNPFMMEHWRKLKKLWEKAEMMRFWSELEAFVEPKKESAGKLPR